MKILLADKNRKPEDFSNDAPYVIMFGPDRCGGTQKTHFILRHQNPLNSEWEEKHYNPAVPPKSDHQTHLYTLEIRPDNQVRVYIDGEQVTAGSLLENMVPPISPPLEIDDPADKKPADWVDDKTIPDLKAEKPADWDQPKTIYDDNAIKPEDWDEETDGEWEPPEVPNPDFKGEWKAPQISNPAYKGEWKPKKIPNPHYFVDQHPHNLPEIDGIGFDLWTMNDGIVFDNIIVTTDKAIADKFGAAGFSPRAREETRVVTARKAALEKDSFEFDSISKVANSALKYMAENPIVAAAVVVSTIGLMTVFAYACTLVCCPSNDAAEAQTDAPKKEKSDKGKAKESDSEDSGEEDAKKDDAKAVSSEDSKDVRQRKSTAKKD
jgi:calnexin